LGIGFLENKTKEKQKLREQYVSLLLEVKAPLLSKGNTFSESYEVTNEGPQRKSSSNFKKHHPVQL